MVSSGALNSTRILSIIESNYFYFLVLKNPSSIKLHPQVLALQNLGNKSPVRSAVWHGFSNYP